MSDKYYTTWELSCILKISTTAVCELKKIFGFRKIDDCRLTLLQETVDKITQSHDIVTTSTINRYVIERENENKPLRTELRKYEKV